MLTSESLCLFEDMRLTHSHGHGHLALVEHLVVGDSHT